MYILVDIAVVAAGNDNMCVAADADGGGGRTHAAAHHRRHEVPRKHAGWCGVGGAVSRPLEGGAGTVRVLSSMRDHAADCS